MYSDSGSPYLTIRLRRTSTPGPRRPANRISLMTKFNLTWPTQERQRRDRAGAGRGRGVGRGDHTAAGRADRVQPAGALQPLLGQGRHHGRGRGGGLRRAGRRAAHRPHVGGRPSPTSPRPTPRSPKNDRRSTRCSPAPSTCPSPAPQHRPLCTRLSTSYARPAAPGRRRGSVMTAKPKLSGVRRSSTSRAPNFSNVMTI